MNYWTIYYYFYLLQKDFNIWNQFFWIISFDANAAKVTSAFIASATMYKLSELNTFQVRKRCKWGIPFLIQTRGVLIENRIYIRILEPYRGI